MRTSHRGPGTNRLLLACVLLPAAGCGDVWGPERFATTTVHGRLTWNGEPIAGGWLEFSPVEGTTGVLRSAQVGPDGSFESSRVPVGTVGIRLIGAPRGPEAGGDPERLRFLHEVSQSYGISRTITSGDSFLAINLADEASRRQAP